MKKGIYKFLLLIISLFLIINLSGCDNVLEIFYTEEKTKQVTNDNKNKTNNITTKGSASNTSTESSLTYDFSTISQNSNKKSNRSTTFTYINKTTTESSETEGLVYTTTESTCEHTSVQYNGKQYSQFGYYGYDGGTKCSKCNAVLSLDFTDPYGKILYSHSNYIENNGEDQLLVSYSIFINEDDVSKNIYKNGSIDTSVNYRFTMVKNEYSNSLGYKISYYTGKTSVYNDEIYILKYDNQKRNDDYAIYRENEFYFVNSEGSTSQYQIVNKSVNENREYNPRKGNTDYGYYFLNNYENSKYLKALYYDFYILSEGLYNSTDDVPSIYGNYLVSIIDTRKYDLSYNEILGVWNLFVNCSPVYYFLSNRITVVNGIYPALLINSSYSSSTARSSTLTKYIGVIDEIDNKIQLLGNEVTDKDIIKVINDYLCDEIEYAWKDTEKTVPEDSVWAHSICGLLLYNKGVCECYSKWFLLLTQYYNIDSLIVTGNYNGSGHSWNVVYLNNEWYGVDVTWNDQESGKIYKYLCCSDTVINEKRTVDDYLTIQMSFQYRVPEISNKSITW